MAAYDHRTHSPGDLVVELGPARSSAQPLNGYPTRGVLADIRYLRPPLWQRLPGIIAELRDRGSGFDPRHPSIVEAVGGTGEGVGGGPQTSNV